MQNPNLIKKNKSRTFFKQKVRDKGLFIVFEGMDGTGKTTCAKGVIEKLKEKYEFHYSKGIGSKTILGRLARKYPSTLIFCLELIFITLSEIRQFLKKGAVILQDRYNFTIATYALSSENKMSRLFLKIFNPLFKNPDLIIYFTVSLPKQIERLKSTAEQNKYHRILIENPELITPREKKYRELLGLRNDRLVIIDTSNETEEETINRVALVVNNFIQNEGKIC